LAPRHRQDQCERFSIATATKSRCSYRRTRALRLSAFVPNAHDEAVNDSKESQQNEEK
jgi:hypothetical protein